MKHLRKFNEGIIEDRVNSYIKIAKIKYADKTADEIIDIIENGNENMRFNSDEEKNLFKSKWSNVDSIKEGMDVDYIAAKGAIDELESLLMSIEHGERANIADDIINFVDEIKKKYKEN